MKKIEYFSTPAGAPKPLEKSVFRTVRFNEIDPMGIMWHGHYAGFIEDARVALGDSLGIGYQDFYDHGVMIPLRQFHVDYLAPLLYAKTYEIKARLFYCESARLNYDFTILDENQKVMARGCSVQLMVDKDHNLLFEWPEFTRDFFNAWKEGSVKQK
ncbi:acyl-CoA thioesterase [Candidatus Avelusimicrobium alvi]|uniref:acyl-CoA thioesterase n=1 Tax=Candidatus Avelusimicrobium alvi TaxID=3416221 RepID=UPI003D104ACC